VGLVDAAAEVYAEARWQRCVVHGYRNVFSLVPNGKVADVGPMLKAIHAQAQYPLTTDSDQQSDGADHPRDSPTDPRRGGVSRWAVGLDARRGASAVCGRDTLGIAALPGRRVTVHGGGPCQDRVTTRQGSPPKVRKIVDTTFSAIRPYEDDKVVLTSLQANIDTDRLIEHGTGVSS